MAARVWERNCRYMLLYLRLESSENMFEKAFLNRSRKQSLLSLNFYFHFYLNPLSLFLPTSNKCSSFDVSKIKPSKLIKV